MNFCASHRSPSVTDERRDKKYKLHERETHIHTQRERERNVKKEYYLKQEKNESEKDGE